MKFYSLNKKAPPVSFKDAVIAGIAPDRGLYFPENIVPLPDSFFEGIEHLSNQEIAFQAIHQFVSEDIPDAILNDILEEVLDFEFPVIEIEENIATLELFHGPTMAFKDVGARFMAQCLGYFSRDNKTETSQTPNITVLVATSGDTGGAVANGFLGVEGVKVVILYPEGRVSDIQERQLTTLGQNITALKVDGTFDDCQKMVKTAFLDEDLLAGMQLTSANSINVARWLPQLFYFLFAYKQVQLSVQKRVLAEEDTIPIPAKGVALGTNGTSSESKDGKGEPEGQKVKSNEIVFSIPSGNFGNVCAGMVAQKLGMPVKHFIAATNVNDTVPEFMLTGEYNPKPSTATISNAMDVGDPSNFIRIRHLYQNDYDALKKNLSSFAFTDEETKEAILKIHQKSSYIVDPHGAVGYLGLKKYLENEENAGKDGRGEDEPSEDVHGRNEVYGIFLETAHPIKFLDVVEATIGKSLEVPSQIEKVMDKEKKFIRIKSYRELKDYLLQS